MGTLICLRELPGVAEIEEALHVPGWHLLKQYDDLEERIAALSRRLFGLSASETGYTPGPSDGYFDYARELFIFNEEGERRCDAWELNFEFLEYEYDEEAGQFWTAFGWDVTNGAGAELLCMEYFGRPLAALLKNVHPAARLSLTGDDPLDATREAEEWGKRLEEQARAFRKR